MFVFAVWSLSQHATAKQENIIKHVFNKIRENPALIQKLVDKVSDQHGSEFAGRFEKLYKMEDEDCEECEVKLQSKTSEDLIHNVSAFTVYRYLW